VAELVFFSGTMDCGKSTLALQMDYNHRARGRGGIRFSRNDRAGDSVISSRLGLRSDAVEVTDGTDFWEETARRRTGGLRVDYLICDEAQFYSPEQVEQLARLVDEMDVDVFAFGITTDFRARLFPGSQRLVELADRIEVLQVQALCWCGRRATHNARTVDGIMVVTGEQVMVGDVATDVSIDDGGPAERGGPVIGYETLCRRHYMRRVTAHAADLMAGREQSLPFELDACLWQGTGGQREPHGQRNGQGK
jgi:thymidine kinase